MTTYYVEITNARLVIEGKDATYAVQFDNEMRRGYAWEFNPMSDASNTIVKRTGNIRVRFAPVEETMAFPEDVKRLQEYILTIDKARRLWKYLTNSQPNYWFALDVATSANIPL